MLLALLGGCAGKAPVSPPLPTGTAADACTSLVRALPQELRDQPRRLTAPESSYVAAWGDPAIVLRCGVGLPASYLPTSLLTVVNDVGWLPEPGSDEAARDATFTRVGRVAHVEVFVPDDYAPASAALAELSAVVTEHVPTIDDSMTDGNGAPAEATTG